MSGEELWAPKSFNNSKIYLILEISNNILFVNF